MDSCETIIRWARKSFVSDCLRYALYLLSQVIYGMLRLISSFFFVPLFISRRLAEWEATIGELVAFWFNDLSGKSKAIRFHTMVIGNVMDSYQDFLTSLGLSPQDQVLSEDQSDVIIAFVAIVSRAGTDIAAALKYIPGNRPVVFVVLHHTFDPDSVVPDSRQLVSNMNMLTVDCLVHEDWGLLKCRRNTEALDATAKYLRKINANYKVPGRY